MPKIVNDEMVELPEDIKKVIKRIGYNDCARLLGKTPSYMRCLAAKGDKLIRRSDLDILNSAREMGR